MLAPLNLLMALALAAAAPPHSPQEKEKAKARGNDPAGADADASALADPSWKALGPALWFDPKGPRLIVRARVVFREGPLEHLLCLKGTKEHEAILATEAAPYQIQAG